MDVQTVREELGTAAELRQIVEVGGHYQDAPDSECVPETTKGKRICFGFNLGNCKVKGNSCDKGLHVCCKKWCFQSHAYTARHS